VGLPTLQNRRFRPLALATPPEAIAETGFTCAKSRAEIALLAGRRQPKVDASVKNRITSTIQFASRLIGLCRNKRELAASLNFTRIFASSELLRYAEARIVRVLQKSKSMGWSGLP
jgi:hypothetical protein